jgi:hypothetical protein
MPLLKFSSKIQIINGNPYVRPPDHILLVIFQQADKDTSPIPIKGKLNGAPFVQTLVRYDNDWRLYVNIIMANAAEIPFSKSIAEIVGREVEIKVEFDPNPPTYEMVEFLKDALEANPTARKNWDKLIPSRQKEILRYFSWLKSDEAKERNIKKLLEALTGSEIRFMARTWKDGK